MWKSRLLLFLAIALALPAVVNAQQRTVSIGIADANYKDGLETLARQYEELNPGVTVKVNIVPGMTYVTWIRAAIAGGDEAPDIFNANYGQGFFESGRTIALTPYLDMVNPYTGVPWRDSFYQEYLDAFKVGAEYSMVPMNYIEIGIYYNQDIFDRVGVAPPGNWREFMDACEAIRAAGYIPIAVPADMDSYWQGTVGWMMRFFTDAYFFDRVPLVMPRPGDYLFDPEREGQFQYDPGDRFSDALVSIQMERVLQAILDGEIAFDGPELHEIWTYIHEFSQHWQMGFHGTDPAGANRLFLTQSAAMMINISAFMQFIDRSLDEMKPENRFEYGVFQIPPLEESELAVIPFRGVGGPLPVFGIVRKSPEQSALAADFLMYMTTPEAGAILLEKAIEAEQYVIGPFVIRDVPMDPELAARFEPFLGLGREKLTFRGLADEQESSWRFSVLAQDFMGGARSRGEFLDLYQRSMVEAIPRIIRMQDLDMDPGTRDNNGPLLFEVRDLVGKIYRARPAALADRANAVAAFVEELRANARPSDTDAAPFDLVVDKTLPVRFIYSDINWDKWQREVDATARGAGYQYALLVDLRSTGAPGFDTRSYRPTTDEVIRNLSGRRYSNAQLREIYLIR